MSESARDSVCEREVVNKKKFKKFNAFERVLPEVVTPHRLFHNILQTCFSSSITNTCYIYTYKRYFTLNLRKVSLRNIELKRLKLGFNELGCNEHIIYYINQPGYITNKYG